MSRESRPALSRRHRVFILLWWGALAAGSPAPEARPAGAGPSTGEETSGKDARREKDGSPGGSDAPSFEGLLAPRPPLSPEASLQAMQVEPGFRVELVAAEPGVVDPIALAFDEDGRLCVCEDRDYPFRPSEGDAPLGRVRLLEDEDGDGFYETSSVFAERVQWPSGVVCSRGGVFVAAPPEILYLKDTDGDRRADTRRVVYEGFGTHTAEDILNNLRWGMDNLIYGAASYNGGDVRRAGGDGSDPPVSVRGRSFRFHPDTLHLESIPETGDFGNCFDDRGNRFVSNAGMLLMHHVIPGTYLDRNPHLAPTRVLHRSAASKRRMAQISPPERWRVLRKRYWDRWVDTTHDMRAERFSEAELAEKGHVTGAAGCSIYRGSAFPGEFLGDSFTAEPAGNLVIRLEVEPRGVTFDAVAVTDRREFLASEDNGFRPVNIANGPDGCLYVLDMSRHVIEDPSAIPQDILDHLDVTAGRDRGRIYRVVPEGFRRPAPPRLSGATVSDLVAALEHRNAWHRETAQRLLGERGDRGAAALLRAMARTSELAEARLHALWTLDRLEELDEATIRRALRDEHASVREHAVRLAEPRLDEAAGLLEDVVAMAEDEAVRVRFQVALSLGGVDDRALAVPALARILRRDGGDRWMRLAVLTAVPGDPGSLFRALAGSEPAGTSDHVRDAAGELLELIGARGDPAEIAGALRRIGRPLSGDSSRPRVEWLGRLAEGSSRSGKSLRAVIDRYRDEDRALARAIDALFREAAAVALDGRAAVTERLDALQVAAHGRFEDVAALAGELLSPRQPPELQVAAAPAVSGLDDDQRVARLLIERWSRLGPAVKREAAEGLFRRPGRLRALLDAVEAEAVPAAELDPARIDALRHHEDESIARRAAKLFAPAERRSREEVIRGFGDALTLRGDARRGEAIFQERCAACHRTGGAGDPVGAELAGVSRMTREELLAQIIDPNRKVEPRYVNYVLTTTDGEILTGIIAAESPAGITLRRPNAVEETVPRERIHSLRSSGLSLMPEGLEQDLTARQMADLLAYVERAARDAGDTAP